MKCPICDAIEAKQYISVYCLEFWACFRADTLNMPLSRHVKAVFALKRHSVMPFIDETKEGMKAKRILFNGYSIKIPDVNNFNHFFYLLT